MEKSCLVLSPIPTQTLAEVESRVKVTKYTRQKVRRRPKSTNLPKGVIHGKCREAL